MVHRVERAFFSFALSISFWAGIEFNLGAPEKVKRSSATVA